MWYRFGGSFCAIDILIHIFEYIVLLKMNIKFLYHSPIPKQLQVKEGTSSLLQILRAIIGGLKYFCQKISQKIKYRICINEFNMFFI